MGRAFGDGVLKGGKDRFVDFDLGRPGVRGAFVDPLVEPSGDGTRVDLHMHSRASGVASNPWIKGLGPEGAGVHESYTPPQDAYRMAKAAGMDFVTLTDHETISGAAALAPLHGDFFVSEEVNAVFPEDGSQVDVLVYGLDAAQHEEAQARRPNVYALVEFLREAGLAHVLAHPVYGVPGDLDREKVEKRLLLFGHWEFVNGSRPARQNRLAREIARGIGPAELRQLALRHGLPVPPHTRIVGTAGSDDHGCLYIGATHTVGPAGIKEPAEFLEALKAGEVRPAGEDGSAEKVAHAGVRITGQALGGTSTKAGEGVIAALVGRLAGSLPRPPSRALGRLFGSGSGGAGGELLPYAPLLARLDMAGMRRALVSRYEDAVAGAIGGIGSGVPAIDLLSSVGTLADAHLPIAPYVGVHGYFGRENGKARALEHELFPDRPEPVRIGVFVDGPEDAAGDATVDLVPGTSLSYRDLAAMLPAMEDASLSIVRCGDAPEGGTDQGLRTISELPVPFGGGSKLGVPSLLEVVDHAAEAEYTVLHVASPGPLGLAALVAGLVLGVPVVAAYRPELTARARELSGDAMVAEVAEAATRGFYERCAAVVVPDGATFAHPGDQDGRHAGRYEVLGGGPDRSPEAVLKGFVALHARVVRGQSGAETSGAKPPTPVPVGG